MKITKDELSNLLGNVNANNDNEFEFTTDDPFWLSGKTKTEQSIIDGYIYGRKAERAAAIDSYVHVVRKAERAVTLDELESWILDEPSNGIGSVTQLDDVLSKIQSMRGGNNE